MRSLKLSAIAVSLLFINACEDKADVKTGTWNFTSASTVTTATSNVTQDMVNSLEKGTGSINVTGDGVNLTLEYGFRYRWPGNWATDHGFSNVPLTEEYIYNSSEDGVNILFVSLYPDDPNGYIIFYTDGYTYYSEFEKALFTEFSGSTPYTLEEIPLIAYYDYSSVGLPDTLYASGTFTPAVNTIQANTPTEIDFMDFGIFSGGSLEFRDDETVKLTVQMDIPGEGTETEILVGKYEFTGDELHIIESEYETIVFDYMEEGNTITLSLTEDICDDGDCNDISVMLDAAENSLTSVEMKITITFTN